MRGLWMGAVRGERAFECGCDDLRQVQGAAVGALGDLFAATEAVGDDQAVGRGLADRRQSSSSPIAMETSYFSSSKPKEPAIPQQPGAGALQSMPIFRRTDSSSVIFMSDL